MNLMYRILIIVVAFSFLYCDKTENEVEAIPIDIPNTTLNTLTLPPPDTVFSVVEGVYLGETYIEQESSVDGEYSQWDTTYSDTYTVALVGIDSISFTNSSGFAKIYMRDSTHYYEDDAWGNSSVTQYWIENDTLTYSYWSYGGDGEDWSQGDAAFVGVKE